MEKKTAVVTGANSGIGFEMTKHLVGQGWQVAMVCRNLERGTAARETILSQYSVNNQHSPQELKLFIADLSLEQDCLRVAREIQDWSPNLHVLINNAGGYFARKQMTSEGIEYTTALNHLGYYRLTLALLPLLQSTAAALESDNEASAPVRVVNVSSGAHRMGKIVVDQLDNPTKYRAFKIYGDSKLANIYFTRELAKRLEAGNRNNGTDTPQIAVNCFHPGFVRTNFGKQEAHTTGSRIFSWLMSKFAITPEQGAQTGIWLATSPGAAKLNGTYCYKSEPVNTTAGVIKEEDQKALWEWSKTKSPGTPVL